MSKYFPKILLNDMLKLRECHHRLWSVIYPVYVNRLIPFKIITGFRNEIEQNLCFHNGRSKKKWPESMHNKTIKLNDTGEIIPCSGAIDVAPTYANKNGVWVIDWESIPAFSYLAGMIMWQAKKAGIGLIWGGDWNNDGNLSDGWDFGHFELTEKEWNRSL